MSQEKSSVFDEDRPPLGRLGSLPLDRIEKYGSSTDITNYWRWSELQHQFLGLQRGATEHKHRDLVRLLKGSNNSTLRRQFIDAAHDQYTLRIASAVPHDLPRVRGCICSCYCREFLSGTFRGFSSRESVDFDYKNVVTDEPADGGKTVTSVNWRPCGDFPNADVQNLEIVDTIWRLVCKPPTNPTGLIVISGATNSKKSTIAKGLVLRAIGNAICEASRNPKRRVPHLVTYEDPIESWEIFTDKRRKQYTNENGQKRDKHRLSLTNPPDPGRSQKFGFCLTPRELGKDVSSLSIALKDALRQTPACFYVGEVRDHTEWHDILEFAGTGHLIVATTHASSLLESMGRILKGGGSTTPARRREIAARLQACVHLVSHPSRQIILPSIWTRTGAAVNSLVANGLASCTPQGRFVRSRLQFFIEVLDHWPQNMRRINKNDQEDIKREVLKLDLQELISK